MTVLVAGGAGFIGSHLAEALVARGEDVVVLDEISSGNRENLPEGIDLVEGDVREPQDELFAGMKPTVCYHLAALIDVRVSVARPDHDAHMNVLGTVNMLQAALEHDTQVVFSSSAARSTASATGPHQGRPAAADRPSRTAKLSGEEYLATFNRLHGTRHISLRYGNVYGPRGPARRGRRRRDLFNKLREDAGPGTPPTARRRATTYSSAVVRATIAAAGHEGGVFNVGTGPQTSVVELLELCQRTAGTSLEAEYVPARPGELQRSVLDPARAVDELGWRPEKSLEDGLRETWESSRG